MYKAINTVTGEVKELSSMRASKKYLSESTQTMVLFQGDTLHAFKDHDKVIAHTKQFKKSGYSFQPKQKPVTIKTVCQDVIDSIKVEQLTAKKSFFIHNFCTLTDNAKLRGLTPQQFCSKKCSCCAKGAMVINWVKRFNNVDWRDFKKMDIYTDTMPKELVALFGENLLNEIEIAFEQRTFSWTGQRSPEREAELIGRYSKYVDSNDRLIAIMRDIIKNKF